MFLMREINRKGGSLEVGHGKCAEAQHKAIPDCTYFKPRAPETDLRNSLTPPSCLLDAEQILGILTTQSELIAEPNAIGARLLLLVCSANEMRKAA